MVPAAPRLHPRLVNEIIRLSKSRLTAAEITRRVGAKAMDDRLPRPSYERVRVLVMRPGSVPSSHRLQMCFSTWPSVSDLRTPSAHTWRAPCHPDGPPDDDGLQVTLCYLEG
jgi:hypothetical protein